MPKGDGALSKGLYFFVFLKGGLSSKLKLILPYWIIRYFCERVSGYQGVRNVRFSENVTYVLSEWAPLLSVTLTFLTSPFKILSIVSPL